jgi:hypothetical protein
LNVPRTVPEVKGEVKTSGEPMPSVFVICALAGVPVYVALKIGLTMEVPSSTVDPPVKLVMAKLEDREMVRVFPEGVIVSPEPAASVTAPESVFNVNELPPLPPRLIHCDEQFPPGEQTVCQ